MNPSLAFATIRVAALVLCSALGCGQGRAADGSYPDHPVTIVVPAGAGSGPDATARRIAAAVGRTLGQPVLVDNRAGAAGIPGTEFAVHAPPDGYTLYLGTNAAVCINPALYRRLPYDPARDLVPISMATRGAPLLLVAPGLPVHTLAEFVAHAKAHPGQLGYASSGNGSTSQLAMELLKHEAGIELLHVPYKEEARAIGDVIGGQVQATIAFGAVAVAQVEAGRLRALAVAGPRRNPLLPQVPTAAEQGLPGFSVPGWIGFFAPAGTPHAVLQRLEQAFVAAETAADYAGWVHSLGSEAVGSTAREFADELRVDCPRWAAIVHDAGVHVD